jgi:hypothetical protein
MDDGRCRRGRGGSARGWRNASLPPLEKVALSGAPFHILSETVLPMAHINPE